MRLQGWSELIVALRDQPSPEADFVGYPSHASLAPARHAASPFRSAIDIDY